MRTCRDALDVLYPRVNVGSIHSVLAEAFTGRRIENRLSEAVTRLADLFQPTEVAKHCAKFVSERDDHKEPKDVPIKMYLEGIDEPIAREDLPRKLMYAAIAGDEEFRNKLDFSLVRAGRLLWAELLTWQHRYFLKKPLQSCERFRREVQEAIKLRVLASEDGAEFDLELYTLLESVSKPEDQVFRISLPGVVLKGDNKEKINEYDVVSFVLRDGKTAEVWVWGVTTEAGINKKRTDDTAKIQKLKDLLGNRWESDVRTVFNYVHVDGGKIALEVDGVQERR
jgi:hypothetical protein